MAHPRSILIATVHNELVLQCKHCCRVLTSRDEVINNVEELNAVVEEHKCKGVRE